MTKLFFSSTSLLIVVLALFARTSNAQSYPKGMHLELVDSVQLPISDISDYYNFPIVKSDGKSIYYTGGDSMLISVFNFDGTLNHTFGRGRIRFNVRHSHNALLPASDNTLWFGVGRRGFVRYNSLGAPIDTAVFDGNFKGKFYYQDNGEGVTDYAYSAGTQRLIVPVFYFAKDLAHVKNIKYYRESNKLLAVCKIAGTKLTIVDIIADRDPIYYKALYSDLNHADFQFIEEAAAGSMLYVNEMASPDIKVYNLEGQLLNSFGTFAKHPGINQTAIPNPFKLNRDKGGYLGFKSFIESPVYTFIYHDPKQTLTFRGYRSSVKDPTVYKKYKVEIKACNDVTATPLDIAQHAALKSKPYGLQIYNKENKLIYDEITPRPTRSVLWVEGNMVWVDGRADKANKAYWIYKYQIQQTVSEETTKQ